jgi:hypothetical protein
MTKLVETPTIKPRTIIVARLFRGRGFCAVGHMLAAAQKTPASEEAGYSNISIICTSHGPQIRKQLLLAKLLLRPV